MAPGTGKNRQSRIRDRAAKPALVAGDEARDRAFGSIRALVAILQTSARAVEARTGLTNAQLFLLRQIAGTDGLTMNDLAQRTSAAQSSVSVVVARLVRAGHVKRGRVAGDARRVTLAATARGRAALRRAPTPPTERLLAALGTIAASDLRSLARGIEALLSELDAKPSSAPLLFEPPRRELKR